MSTLQTRPERISDLVTAVRHVPAKLLALEPTLIQRRWPAYNFVGPLKLTQIFMRVYEEQFNFSFHYPSSITRDPGHPEFATVWRMRQAADWWTMPYDAYLKIAFTLSKSHIERFTVPHIRFLKHAKNKNLLKKIEKNASLTRAAFFMSDMGPQYYHQNYAGLSSQDRFREIAFEYAWRGNDLTALVLSFVLGRTYIPVADIKRQMFIGRIENMLQDVHREFSRHKAYSVPAVPVQPHELWQTCFAVPGACNPARSPCRSCPVVSNCLQAAEIFSRAAASCAAP